MNIESPILRVESLRIGVPRGRGDLLSIVDTADFHLRRHQALGIVGESGSGKTMLCRALMGTLRRHGAVVASGRILYRDQDLAGADEKVWRRIRGRRIGYVPQSSLAGLNPVLTVRTQLTEAIHAARDVSNTEADHQALQLLDLVRILRPGQVLEMRSHELSGGMRQRVMIAAALSQEPEILIADEPTTALDVTIQREILSLINRLRERLKMALIFVSHDLAVIEEVCDSVMVMYAGASVENGPLDAVVRHPRHPYTRALLASRVDLAVPGEDLETIPGDPASVGAWPDGCRFWPRCSLADADCREDAQPPLAPAGIQRTACLHHDRMEDGP
ncbi:MAG: ABC transporter ATP-binding protein [Acidobacteriota bacterium]|nr:ABC transporter ATP-binding protein [Acidobacteriota bacterium]